MVQLPARACERCRCIICLRMSALARVRASGVGSQDKVDHRFDEDKEGSEASSVVAELHRVEYRGLVSKSSEIEGRSSR